VRDDLRDRLVPINRKYPLAELLEACRNYGAASNARRITFEYVMLKGVNDSAADARALVAVESVRTNAGVSTADARIRRLYVSPDIDYT